MIKATKIIAIDPDVTKSGVAVMDIESRKIDTLSLSFPELMDYLSNIPIQETETTVIAVEAGWLNKPNWHFAKSIAIAGSIGNDVGRNHETGRKIVEMCEHLELSVSLVKPLVKRWKGANRKITHRELESVLKGLKMTLEKKRTNQDERDSIMIAIYKYDTL